MIMYVIIIIIISTVVQLSKKTWNHRFDLAIFYDLHESMIIALVTRGHVWWRRDLAQGDQVACPYLGPN